MKSKRIIIKVLSTLLVMVFLCKVVFADSVYVASSPVNSLSSNNGVLTSNVVYPDQTNDIFSGPNSIPQDGNVISFTASTNATSAGQGVSYTSPVAKTISSPAAYMAQNSSSGTVSQRIDNFGLTVNSGAGVEYTDPVVYNNPGPSADANSSNNSTSMTVGIPTTNTSNVATTTGGNYIPQGYGMSAPYSGGGVTNINNNANYATNLLTTYTLNPNIVSVKPSVSAAAGIVVNATTKQIYYYKDPYTGYNPAGLANLMTAYLLLQYKNVNDVLVVSNRAVSNLESGASTAGLRAGDTILVSDAIAAMFIKSCCDVANCVAENVAGSIENFVTLMNQTAKSFGCVATNFTNPSGLNSDAQLISAYDMAVIIDRVTNDVTLAYYLGLPAYTLPATAHRGKLVLSTKNTILVSGSSRYYQGIGASRMGYTSKALYTMASVLPYNGQKLIAVVLKANGTHFNDTKKMLDFAKLASSEAAALSYTNNAAVGFNTATSIFNNSMSQGISNTNAVVTSVGNIVNTGLTNGETAGTWGQDTNGWYFILANGQRAVNQWIQRENKIYCIDSSGYMITGLRNFSNGNTYYFDSTTGELRYNTWINLTSGAYYLQADGSVAKASPGTTTNITTAVGVYTINDTGRAIAKVS